MNTKDVYWITPGEGVVTSVEGKENVFNNSNFVNIISKDESPVAKLLLSSHPFPTTITLKGDIPPSWKEFIKEEINIENILNMMNNPLKDVSPKKRLMLTRAEISDRVNILAKIGGLKVTPRGITDEGIGETPQEAFEKIVHAIALVIEKNSTASLKNKNRHVSSERKVKILRIIDIIENKENVINAVTSNSYVEPSPTIAARFYSLATLYGIEETNNIINTIYYNVYKNNVNSIVEMKELV